MNAWKVEIENIFPNFKRARKPEKYLLEIDRLKAEIEKYASFFGVKVPKELVKLMSISDTSEYVKFQEEKEKFAAKEYAKKLKLQADKHILQKFNFTKHEN